MDKEKREAIHAILKKLERDGKLAPDHIIEEARNPDSPLHDQFEWDLAKAALETWRAQARKLLSGFEIVRVVNQTTYKIAEFVEDPSKSQRIVQGYVSFETVANNPEMAQRFLDRELGIANTYVEKAANYGTVLGLKKRVEKVSRAIEAIRKTAKINGKELPPPPPV